MGNRLSALKTVTNNALFIHSRRPEDEAESSRTDRGREEREVVDSDVKINNIVL